LRNEDCFDEHVGSYRKRENYVIDECIGSEIPEIDESRRYGGEKKKRKAREFTVVDDG
jgi:hypothetical protein